MNLRYLLDTNLQRLAGLRPRVRFKDQQVQLNIGGGIEVAPGWINVDASIHALIAGAPKSVLRAAYRGTGNVRQMISEGEYVARLSNHRFVFADLEKPWPFDDNSVDFIFCSHVLEHFYLSEARHVVSEMLRVLKPAGIARITVPSLAKAMEAYTGGDRKEALRYFFTDERSRFDQHHYMYDYELMAEILREAGFSDIVECRFQEGRLPDLKNLDNRPEETLFVEAVKY